MPAYSTLIFDLDGTLTDPALGVVRCMNYALTKFDYSPRPEQDITVHIGPPLELTLEKLSGSSDESHIDELAAAYRERYAEFGYRENTVYAGVTTMLEALRNQDTRLGVCTSKLQPYAIKVLETFELIDFFDFVCGTPGKMAKSQQLRELLENDTIDSRSIMIGDRNVDLQAAHSNGLQSAGVLWGYGDLTELNAEQPAHLFERPEQLAQQLTS